MKRTSPFLIVLLTTFLFAGMLNAQESEVVLRQKKISYLSQKMSVSTATATKIISIFETYRNASNRVYHDSTLTTAQRVERLREIRNEKDRQIQAITAAEGKSDGKGKMTPFLKRNLEKQNPAFLSR